MDLREISYLSWIDEGSSKKYLVAMLNNKLVGFYKDPLKRFSKKESVLYVISMRKLDYS